MNSLTFLATIYIGSCIAQPPPPPPLHHDCVGPLLDSPQLAMYSQLTETKFVPHFLQNYSSEAQQQFLDILKDGSVTATAMEEKMKNWLSSQDSQVQAAYNEGVKHITEMIDKIQKDYPSSTLTTEEKAALQKIAEISKKTDLTVQQQYQQAKAILDALTSTQKQQIGQFIGSELPSPPFRPQGPPQPQASRQ